MITVRLPCVIHDSCDETGCRIIHTDKKYAQLSEEELTNDGHDFCEGMLNSIRESIKNVGTWKCPICSVVHTYPNKVLTPNIVVLHPGFRLE